MVVSKKLAARKAAAEHSTDPIRAVMKYMKLTGLLDENFSGEFPFNEARDEMLGLLPAYRHPMNDNFAEYMQFIDYDCMNMSATMFNEPAFLSNLKSIIDIELYKIVSQYVKEAEGVRSQLHECRSKLTDLEKLMDDVHDVYDENSHKRAETRNAKFSFLDYLPEPERRISTIRNCMCAMFIWLGKRGCQEEML